MTLIDRVIATFAPRQALDRARARAALKVMNYDAATSTGRGSSWRPIASDADGAAGKRAKLAYVARDMIRNTPFATRAQAVIVNAVVGAGIIPKVTAKDDAAKVALTEVLTQHLGSLDIDADGRSNLYGLQRLAMNTTVDAGEVLIRRRWRYSTDGYALPFQIQVLEPDFLDNTRDGTLPNGNLIRDGIEYGLLGRRVAYHLFDEHPGAAGFLRNFKRGSSRVDARDIIHLYRQDRPGQMRGVSWFAPVAMNLQQLADFQDAQLMRQKIAACFAAFRVPSDDDQPGAVDPGGLATSIMPGRIQNLGPGEDIKFADPPSVTDDGFTRSTLRAAAVGMGITYEALTGDLTGVNFTSGRMGRLDMDANVGCWQWLMLIPQMMQPLGRWCLEAYDIQTMSRASTNKALKIEWVPPRRIMVDPAREIKAMQDSVRAGFSSRSGTVRSLGYDPEELLAEIAEDNAQADAARLVFDTDPRLTSGAGQAQLTTDSLGDVANGQQ
jgi:lambda family phage portal protein